MAKEEATGTEGAEREQVQENKAETLRLCGTLDGTEGYLFSGYQPAETADGLPAADANRMSYSQLSAYMDENPDFRL